MPSRLKYLICILVIFVSYAAGPARAETTPPNFLFILADDQSPFQLSVYNPDSTLETPNLDRLAREGITFDGAYHMGSFSGAVCTPSRHMIMCGRTLWRLPISPTSKVLGEVSPGLSPEDIASQTLAAVFNRAGYDTMRTCKVGNSYPQANKQFTTRAEASKRGGADESGSAWHANQVLEFLEQRDSRGEKSPFFIYLGFSHPHDVRDGKPELLAKYGATNHQDESKLPEIKQHSPKLPINYLPQHPFHHGHPGLRDEEKVSGVWKKRDEASIRNEMGREHACSENIDTQIGRVVNRLEELGQLDNTYVFYTSDHGIAVGRHGLLGKQNLYEHTWRVPFIVSGPNIAPASRAQGNIYLLDVLSTLCDLAGLDIPATNEGKSFHKVLQGEAEVVRDVLYGVYCGGTKPGIRAVKKGPWKLIKYDVLQSEVQQTQLFNLEENPHELLLEHREPDVVSLVGNSPTDQQKNLADEPAYVAKLAEMESLLLQQQKIHGDIYRLWDQPKLVQQEQ